MTPTVLSTWRPWHQRLFDLAQAWAASLPRPRHEKIDALSAHALRDIGIDASEVASINAQSWGRAGLSRLRIVAGQRHV